MTNWFKNLFVSKNNILLPKVSETDIIEVRTFALNGWKLGETHGLSHWQRVERNGILLSTENGSIRKDVDLKVVRFFAYLHDKCRLNDWADLEHGVRSADMLSTIRGTILKDFTDEDVSLLENRISKLEEQALTFATKALVNSLALEAHIKEEEELITINLMLDGESLSSIDIPFFVKKEEEKDRIARTMSAWTNYSITAIGNETIDTTARVDKGTTDYSTTN